MIERQHSRPRREDFVIGGWRVEPSCNRIFHCGGGIERKLEPRLMHLLCFLAANPGRTLSRDDLVAELWPRVIVTENSLTRAVSELRKHLCAAGGGLVKIETVPKKGYRLVVEQAANANVRRRALPWPAFALPVFAMAIVAGGWLTERDADPVASYQSEIALAEFGQEFVPVSSSGGGLAGLRHEAPVLSADGSRFAFIRHDASGSTIWLGDLSGGAEPVAVYVSSLPLSNLVWSPAGDALLFARQGAITAEAVYGGAGSTQLMQFDLESWTVTRLVEEPEGMEQPLPTEIDLT
ncbi:MAG: winged helix-turn-helix domain-containing protein [Gammaproteobacteria bacterium]|nr:winged helix-turn-helix domain-containing protein [Gammaproteobacteria bacterium]